MKIVYAALVALPIAASIACGGRTLNSHDGGTAGTGEGGTAGINTGQAGTTGIAGTTGTGGAGAGTTGGTGGTAGINTGQAGTGGTGGTTAGSGNAGTGGTGHQGGTGGFGGKPPPSCLTDLLATCPLAGSCQVRYTGTSQKSCFAGGETVSVVSDYSCQGTSTQSGTTEVRRADGTLCYSIEWSCLCGRDCTRATIWKNGAGEVVARGLVDRNTSHPAWTVSVACEATAETCSISSVDPGTPTVPVGESCVPMAATDPATNKGCTEGTCP
jgi:hypothetical protein